jgi:hypothetical protein
MGIMKTTRRSFIPASLAGGLACQRPRLNRDGRTSFIQTDDRFRRLGLHGNPVIRPPTWTGSPGREPAGNAFVTTAICCSSRASVLTGQHRWRHGIRLHRPIAGPMDLTIRALQRAGYRTIHRQVCTDPCRRVSGLAGLPLASEARPGFAWQQVRLLSIPGNQLPPGRWRQKRHLTPLMTSGRRVSGPPPERPFCLSLNSKEPHGPHNYF